MSLSVYTGPNPFNFIRRQLSADLLVPKCTATLWTHGTSVLLVHIYNHNTNVTDQITNDT